MLPLDSQGYLHTLLTCGIENPRHMTGPSAQLTAVRVGPETVAAPVSLLLLVAMATSAHPRWPYRRTPCCISHPPSNGPAGGCRKSRFRVDGLRCRCRLAKPRCQRNTMTDVTIQYSRQAWENNPASAANTTRSTQDRRALLTWRRNTTTSWRSTRISAFFDRELQASSPSQATNCRKIR
jgi:hypothetical protein